MKTKTLLLTVGVALFAAPFLALADETNLSAAFPEAAPAIYVGDFVSTAAFGVAMNDVGDVIGTSYPDPGCGSFCLPTLETVVWRAGQRIVLPTLPGFSGITVRSINNAGWIAGLAGFPGTTTRAVVWKPMGDSYTMIDLGVLPGTMSSEAIGIDNQGRVVGWSTTLNFPPNGSPFLWTETGGLVDLSAQGFPDETPIAISPGGTVATPGFWYRLDDPGSVTAMPASPNGFLGPGGGPAAINDAGDQARFLASTGAENLVYPFRFNHEGTWQQISFQGTGHLSTYGVGSINGAKDITLTALSTGEVAYGPDGMAQSLVSLFSPAYQSGAITRGGPMNASGQILAQVLIGNSARLMRLVPSDFCAANCVRVSSIQMKGKFVQDPNDPGHCSPDNTAHNMISTKITVTNEIGMPLAGFKVSGRFLDDYWSNNPVAAKTNSNGQVSFKLTGPCGVGAVAFLIDSVQKGGLTLDKTTGVVSASVIPQ